MSNPTDREALAPAATGSLLEQARLLLRASKEELASHHQRTSLALPIRQASKPGVATAYARYRLPSMQQVNRVMAASGKPDKPNPYAQINQCIAILVNLCEGVFVVSDDDYDTELAADLTLPEDKLTDPAYFPRFSTPEGVAAIAGALCENPEEIKNGHDLVKDLYAEGEIPWVFNQLVQEAGYIQGN